MQEIQAVTRVDHWKIDAWEETSEGYVKARVIAGRTGCQTYYYDGLKFVEYRPPQEVFNPTSYKTLDNKAFTDEHPPVMLTAENTKDYARGIVTGPTRPYQNSYLETWVLITDAETIQKIKDGLAEVSCGYTCDVVKQPGVAPDGTKYDGYQTNIRYNHLSRVNRGRAGSEVRVRFDAAIQEETQKQGEDLSPMEMTKIKLDAGEFDVPSAAAIAIHSELKQLRKDAEDRKAQAQKAKSDLDALQGKYDQACSDFAEAKKQLDAAQAVDVNARANELANVRLAAKPFLKADDKTDGLSVIELKKLALANQIKNLPQDKTDAYYEARFDAMVENSQVSSTPPQFQSVVDAAQEQPPVTPGQAPAEHKDAYTEMIEALKKENQGVKA